MSPSGIPANPAPYPTPNSARQQVKTGDGVSRTHTVRASRTTVGERRAPALGPYRQPLSIAMLAPCPFPTHQGTQVLIRHIATALAEAGHDVHLITYGHGEYDADFPFKVHRTMSIARGLRSGPTLLKPFADMALLFTAMGVVRQYGCDVVHAHNIEGLAVGALLKVKCGVPMVYHAHNALGHELPTYFKGRTIQALASAAGDAVDRTLPHMADAVITFNSDHKAFHEIYGIDSERLHVIPPGLDATELRKVDMAEVRRLQGELGQGPWILYAGNPDTYQNLALLWDAFHRVRRSRPDARLLVATSHDPSTFDAELDAAPSREGVVVHQFKSFDELKAMFRLADIGASPRTLWTGVPIKLLNYLAVGLPSVACRGGGRHVLSGSCTRLVDDNAESFAQGLLELLQEFPRHRDRIKRSFERFKIDNHIPLYEAAYAQALGRPSGEQRPGL